MSLNVLIIPEDFRKDQYVLRPIIRAMFSALKKDRAKVEVCLDPLLGGIGKALDAAELTQIIKDRPMFNLFLLLVDRDADTGRSAAIANLESKLEAVLPPGAAFLGEHAWQEIEVWALAGQNLPKAWNWAEIRAERDPKERFFNPFAKERGLEMTGDGGREKLGLEAAKKYRTVHARCKEDIQLLHQRVEAWLNGKTIPPRP